MQMTPFPLEIRNLSHSFEQPERGRLEVLRDVHLTIHAGERLAILGPSGSGKSTLLSLMAGLQKPTSGQVLWSGQSIHDRPERELSALRPRKIALIFQQFLLIPHLTALENVSLPLELQGIALTEARRQAHEKLCDLGLADRLDHFPRMLSGGECQRVAIARALVARPEVLLADEPTGNLDPRTAEQVFELLLSLPKKGEIGALVLVTHNEALAALCDRRLRLADGCFSEDGPLSEGRPH